MLMFVCEHGTNARYLLRPTFQETELFDQCGLTFPDTYRAFYDFGLETWHKLMHWRKLPYNVGSYMITHQPYSIIFVTAS